MTELPDALVGFTPMKPGEHHLRDGFCFARDGGEVVITDRKGQEHQIRVPLNEWASVLAHTSSEGDTGEKWRAALEFLGANQP